MRIGLGYDIHCFEENKPLKLGGVTIPHHHGLKGHSDGDCLLHAISDAIYGALAQGDIGEHFSDKDPKNKNINSLSILQHASQLAKEMGYVISNVDSNIITQTPKLSPFKKAIQENIAKALNLKTEQVSVKAKTNEGLDAIGQEKALAAQAIVLLVKS